MKLPNRWLLGLVFALLGLLAFFATRHTGGPPPPGPGAAPAPEKEKTAFGIVKGFKSNPHLDVNAIQLQTGPSGMLTIDFLPHTAQAVMGITAPGDSVKVNYDAHANDEVVGYRLRRIRNQGSGKEVALDELPPPPDIPPNHAAEYFSIHNPNLILDEYGGIVAIRSGRLLFHFKPGLVDDLLPLIKTASQLGLSAVWRDDHFGFVNVNHDKVYIVLSVTIDNKTFLVR